MKIECVNPAMLARIRSTHLLTFHHPDNKKGKTSGHVGLKSDTEDP